MIDRPTSRILVVPQHCAQDTAARGDYEDGIAMPVVKRCQVRGCPQKHYGKGFCKKHYTQVTRHGGLTPERERSSRRKCEAAGCDRGEAARCRGGAYLCKKHARQVRKHGKLTPASEHAYRKYRECSAPGCKRAHRAKGFCTKHYNATRWQKIKAAVGAAQVAPAADLVAANPACATPAVPAEAVSQ